MSLNTGDSNRPYEITGLLGKGGMGEVFMARDTRLNRSTAIKFLFAELTDAAARRAFGGSGSMLIACSQDAAQCIPVTASPEGWPLSDE